MQKLVSVIMGVYNGADTLSQAIDSIIAQTYTDWELIVCDDCSTDETYQILMEYAEADNRIKVIRNEKNCGLASSLNHCLAHVRGELIARMDCDDISVETRLEKQVTFLENHPEFELVGTFMQAFNEFGKQNVIESKQHPTKYDLPKGPPFAHATIMMRTTAMKQLNGYHISKHTVRTEDVDLWYRFFSAGFNGVNLPEALYLVRVDDAAYKRRKLKYMLHASYIIWYGCGMVDLPFYYRIYCIKPILSWLLPHEIKTVLRRWIVR